MIERKELVQYLKAGCKVSVKAEAQPYKVIRDTYGFKVIPYTLSSIPRTYYDINQITRIHSWPMPRDGKYTGWALIRSTQYSSLVSKSLRDAGLIGKWVKVYEDNTTAAGRSWISILPNDVQQWSPVKPDSPDGTVLVALGEDDSSSSTGTRLTGPIIPFTEVEEIHQIFTIDKEKTMEDIKLFKPENLARAKEIAEQQRNDEETQKAKAFYEACINKIDAIDRQMKALTAEKAEWEAKLKPFTEAADKITKNHEK